MAMEPYALPPGPRARRHGPYGYIDYRTYKDWLRDEFQFRCALCMHREKWERRGRRIFHVDHIIPRSVDDGKTFDYDNLTYLCDACNEAKSDWVIPDPCKYDYAAHFKFEEDGAATAISDLGDLYIAVLKLNETYLVEYRRDLIRKVREFEELAPDLDEEDLLVGLNRYFGYPDDIPDLRAMRPKGNTRPDGKNDSYFLKLRRKEINPYY